MPTQLKPEKDMSEKSMQDRVADLADAMSRANLELASVIGAVAADAAGKEATPSAAGEAVLTRDEECVARELFIQVFPDLVRKESSVTLKAATEKAVTAIKAGLISLRCESSCSGVESALKSLEAVDEAFNDLRAAAAKVLSESRPAALGPGSC